MSQPPTVSIGLPVRNGERYPSSSMVSIPGQTFGELELVISDKGSRHDTVPVCERYPALNPRVRGYRNPKDIGGASNHQLVFRLARGRFPAARAGYLADVARRGFTDRRWGTLAKGAPVAPRRGIREAVAVAR